MLSVKWSFKRIFLLVALRWCNCKDVKPHIDSKKEPSQVEVRAVYINCEPEEWRGSASENEAKRFEREELFKHGALRECHKKIALTVKMASESDSSSDEYIPVEHVFEGPGKKRVRLLNPYVLRLRRELPLQAYKLRRIEIVSGVLTRSVDKSVDADTTARRSRVRRDIEKGNVEGPPMGSSLTLTLGREHECKRKQFFTLLTKDCDIGVHSCRNDSVTAWKRVKRQEHNIVVDEGNIPWTTKEFFNTENDASYYSNKDNTASVSTIPFNDNSERNEMNPNKGFDRVLQRKILPRSDIINRNRNNFNTLKTTIKIDKDRLKTIKTGSKGKSVIKERDKHFTKSNFRRSDSSSDSDTDERYFAMFQILDPELWYSVQIQLFEKMSTPDGKTVWNDMTKGEPARLTSTYPEWSSRDINIKYRPAMTLKRDDYTLPLKTLVLLIPIQRDNVNSVQDDTSTVIDNDSGNYIVIPMEDVTRIEIEKRIQKRSPESLDDNTPSSKTKKYRRVSVRISRQVVEGNEGLKILSLGSDLYLTIPHRRRYGALIDLEARADENQLVRVGSFGRIIIAVSDNTRVSRTTLTVQATNTGLAAARFRIKVLDCGPELTNILRENDGEAPITDSVLLPPKHTRRFRIDLPIEFPTDSAHCSVALINEEEDAVAVRDVSIKRGDRCFCVWYCDCVCLSEDPKLLCREMTETRLLAAGLSMRERPRRSRSIHCSDSVALNIFFSVIGVFTVLFALGFLKACLGLLFRGVGSWGLDCIVELPRKLQYYHESSLRDRHVQYDEDGWPIHPDTKERTVRLISLPVEYILNLIFFITLPCLVIVNAFSACVTYCKNSSNNSRTTQRFSRMEATKRDFQDLIMQRRRRRRKMLRKWMTPQAEKLSKDLWRAGLATDGMTKKEIMQPLLQEDVYPMRMDDYLSSFADSEQDDTEYVLTQMQKSKESLARNQCKLNESIPISARTHCQTEDVTNISQHNN